MSTVVPLLFTNSLLVNANDTSCMAGFVPYCHHWQGLVIYSWLVLSWYCCERFMVTAYRIFRNRSLVEPPYKSKWHGSWRRDIRRTTGWVLFFFVVDALLVAPRLAHYHYKVPSHIVLLFEPSYILFATGIRSICMCGPAYLCVVIVTIVHHWQTRKKKRLTEVAPEDNMVNDMVDQV